MKFFYFSMLAYPFLADRFWPWLLKELTKRMKMLEEALAKKAPEIAKKQDHIPMTLIDHSMEL